MSFAGLINAQRALMAQLISMEVAGQNIANANTPGYSRQVANHATVVIGGTELIHSNRALALAGVEVAEIKRQYDGFLAARVRDLTANLNEITARHDALARLEELFHEPSDASIGTAMDELWTAFGQLATSPQNESLRNNVLFRAQALTEVLRDTAGELQALRGEVGERALLYTGRVNTLVQNLVDVNERLNACFTGVAHAVAPNALLDQRDRLLRELAQYVDITVTETNTGAVKVTMAGQTLVDSLNAQSLSLQSQADGALTLVINGTVITAPVGGSLGGNLQAHNDDLARYAERLDQLARSLISQVNTVHATGYDMNGDAGGAFFVGDGAGNIALAAGLIGAPEKLAASSVASGIDGLIAQRLADLRQEPTAGDDALMIEYATLISQLGSETAALGVTRENAAALAEHAVARSESVSGVSLDEELADVVRYQQAYAAAARVLTSVDEMLDILINRTGLVGR